MKLSIIMVSLVSSEFRLQIANRAVENLLKYSTDFEFIYVDNNSSFVIKDKNNVDIYLRNKENIGITKAFNQAYKLTKGDTVLFVDNDIDIKENWQEKLFKILDQNNLHSLSPAEILNYEEFQKMNPEKGQIRFPFYHDCFWLIRREVFEKVGLFDENIFCYGEGLDFYIRMCQAGFVSAVTTEVVHWHLHSMQPYIPRETRTKDMLYLKNKWNIENVQKDGINLALQIFKKHNNV